MVFCCLYNACYSISKKKQTLRPINRTSITGVKILGCSVSASSPFTSESEPLNIKQVQCSNLNTERFEMKLFMQLGLPLIMITSYNISDGGALVSEYACLLNS